MTPEELHAMEVATLERDAVVCVSGWAGRSELRVKVLGSTPKKYRVRFLQAAYRWSKDQVTLVPKSAVKFTDGLPAPEPLLRERWKP